MNSGTVGVVVVSRMTCVVPPIVVVVNLGYLKGYRYLTVIKAGCTREIN
jgi:hypothetical protein